MNCQIEKPINVIVLAVEDLQELGKLAEGLITLPQQIFYIGYMTVSKHRISRLDIRKWLRHATVNQTWPEFKVFFAKVHQELRDTNMPVNELSYHSSSAIIE